MLCPKCNGIPMVIKVHPSKDYEPRLCDVQCMDCGEIIRYQPYDFGKNINVVPDKNK